MHVLVVTYPRGCPGLHAARLQVPLRRSSRKFLPWQYRITHGRQGISGIYPRLASDNWYEGGDINVLQKPVASSRTMKRTLLITNGHFLPTYLPRDRMILHRR